MQHIRASSSLHFSVLFIHHISSTFEYVHTDMWLRVERDFNSYWWHIGLLPSIGAEGLHFSFIPTSYFTFILVAPCSPLATYVDLGILYEP